MNDIFGCNEQGWTQDEFGDRLKRKLAAVMRRAGLTDDPGWRVSATSLDSVGRDPMRVPFAAYPLHPEACAQIIGDLSVFTVVTSGQVLTDDVRRAGIEATWIRPPGSAEIRRGEPVMNMTATTRKPAPPALAVALHQPGASVEYNYTLQMLRSELDAYLIQLIDQETWLAGVRYMLADPLHKGRPWPHYRGEDLVWV